MSTPATAFRTLVGLFVDDGALALAIIVVVLLSGIVAMVPDAPLAAGGLLLFGCLGVLFANVIKGTQR